MARVRILVFVSVILSGTLGPAEDSARDNRATPRVVLAHYMPWYVAKPVSSVWGWHWTMNRFQPDQEVAGRRPIASHLYPAIGPYDSSDPHVLEYHLLLMKLAGIDGVIVDWYGRQDFRDYALLHRHTELLVAQCQRLKMRFAICYEDQTVPALVEAGKVAKERRVSHAVGELKWLAEHWFPLKEYVRNDDRPVLLSFGQSGLTDAEWTQVIGELAKPVAYVSQQRQRAAAVGAFDWPLPKEGLAAVERFERSAKHWPLAIPVAFPRFVDIYAEAKVHDSWGRIEDDSGRIFRQSLERAWKLNSPIIQLATWNDWGEGTVIEPSVEYGTRDLEFFQRVRRFELGDRFKPVAADLRMPSEILTLRRRPLDAAQTAALDAVVDLLVRGKLAEARDQLATMVPGSAK